MKKITTKINEKFVDENGILRIRVLENAYIDLDTLKEDHEAGLELTGAGKVLALYDARAFFTITPEARDFVKSGIMDQTRIATAVISDRVATNLLMNFIMKISKPKSPMKIFLNENEAVEWLMQFKS